MISDEEGRERPITTTTTTATRFCSRLIETTIVIRRGGVSEDVVHEFCSSSSHHHHRQILYVTCEVFWNETNFFLSSIENFFVLHMKESLENTRSFFL
mmetsp:Transcript_7641/g.23935  ORF Transcript_7641/g.23935 Transcript_7641/m.23935 type:complete len:98 (-) Transcript_7641:1974-2267(-)